MRVFILALLFVAACSGSDNPDASTLVDGGDGGTRDGGSQATLDFRVEVVDGLGSTAVVGDNAAAAVNGGVATVAYGLITPGGTREIHYAVRNGEDDWATEMVIEPGANAPAGGDLVGLGLAYVNGTASVVYLGGDDDMVPTLNFPTDLMMAERQSAGNWVERTLVDDSTEATGNCSLYCNVGSVVGTHAAIDAAPAGGFAVVYRDTHFGFGVDDYTRSDFEAYAEGGGPTNSMVDAERSAGSFADVAHLADGTPVASYFIAQDPDGVNAVGIWAAVFDGTLWQTRQVSEASTSARTAIETTPDGMIYIAYHDADSDDLVVGSSADRGDTWSTDILEERGKTGLHPSIAIDDMGRPVVGYTYCGPTSERDCPGQLGNDAEVRIQRLEAGAWKMYAVGDGDGVGGVGYFTQVVVEGDGTLGVFYTDDRNGDLLYSRQQ